ncbi:MAG TPA: hypothetical protein VGI87_01765 [Solirubrobacteraceae bacterium]
MFQSSKKRLRTWLSWAEDVLADPSDVAQSPSDNFHTHPHRRPLRWDRPRRPGTVAARPAHCISPVPRGAGVTRREPAAR